MDNNGQEICKIQDLEQTKLQLEKMYLDIIKSFKLISEEAFKVYKQLYIIFIEIYKQLYIIFIEIYKHNPKIKKCYGIYKKTKNRRIRKKQIDKIYKMIKNQMEGEI